MFKLADILKNLESDTPEATFISKLAGETPAPVAETTPAVTPATEPAVAPTVDAEADLKKIAEEADGVGRIMAHSFMDELQKLAVGVVGLTPNPDAIPQNPAVQLSSQDIREADVMKVQKIIQNLTQGERAHAVTGYVQVNGQPMGGVQPVAQDEAPIAFDKKGSDEIVEKLYGKYFGKEN